MSIKISDKLLSDMADEFRDMQPNFSRENPFCWDLVNGKREDVDISDAVIVVRDGAVVFDGVCYYSYPDEKFEMTVSING